MPTSSLIVNRINDAVDDDALITRDHLIKIFQEINPDIKDNAIRNRIHHYTQKGILAQVTNKHYTNILKDIWNPIQQANLNSIWKILIEDYSKNQLCFWTTKWINEFTNLQAFSEVIFIEAEDIIAESVYHRLAEKKDNVFFAPDEKEIDFYIASKEQSYVVRPLITRAPIFNPVPFTIARKKSRAVIRKIPLPRIEKLLTDIYYDNKLLSAWKYEEDKIWQDAYKNYNINFSTIKNYAKRRDNSTRIIDFIISTLNYLPDDIAEFLEEK